VSLDVWSSIKNDQYLGVNIHFIDNFILKKYTIGFEKISNQKAETISDNLCNIIDDFKLNPKYILSFTSDNCSAMKLACKLLRQKLGSKINDKNISLNFFGCFAHIINLIIKSGVLDCEVIIKAKKLAFSIKDSPKINNMLQNVALMEKITYSTIKCNIETRWNSSFIMINSILNNKLILEKVTCTNIFNNKEWEELNTIRSLLKPFYELTNIVSGSKYPTIGLSYSTILNIYKYLDEFSKMDNLKEKSILMKKMFKKYFEYINEEYLIGMVLDPRFKTQLLNKKQTESVKNTINKKIEDYSNNCKENIVKIENL
jgi:hypothetical protein